MAPFQFLFQEHIGDLIWRELRLRRRWVTALDQGQFHPLLGQAIRRIHGGQSITTLFAL
jgi:phosphoribosylpyrophosphate synthetase